MILFTSDLPLLAFNGAIKVLIRVHNINVIINCGLIACNSYTSINRSRTCLVVSRTRSLVDYRRDLGHNRVFALNTYLGGHNHTVIQALSTFRRGVREPSPRRNIGRHLCLFLT